MAMSKRVTGIKDREFERQYKAATQHAKQSAQGELRAKGARYDTKTNRLAIELTNGARFEVPIRLLEEFARASAEDIAEVELLPRGAALHWRELDIDFSVV